ncbi:MAG: minor capsid protein [Clostridia bacterium]|nr:minor capsid protein [Clostridia bacterium]
MTNNKSAEYWRERYKLAEERLYSEYAYKNSEEIKKIFKTSLVNINRETAIWLQRFTDNNNITYAEATRLIGTKELEELGWDVEKYVEKGVANQYTQLWDSQLENASAKFHISRLEALKLQVIDICENMFNDLGGVIENALKNTYTEGYYGTAYELSKGLNAGVNIAKINENLLNKIIHKPWSDDGVEFSERIWGKYRPTLVNRLHKDLTDCVIRGINPQTLAADYAKEFKASENAATNLLMTEYSQFASMSNTDCLNDLGVEEYEIIETLDERTCGRCQSMDKKHFPMSQLKVGINAPPFHNRCRGTKCPYFDDEFTANIKRAARDPETGETVYINDMPYKEWKEKYVTNNVAKSAENGIIKENNVKSGAFEVHTIGKIDRNIYKCITDDIITDEVIITDERVNHIKERHPNDYERFYSYIPEIIANPDYIIEANKPKTAFILKEINYENEKFQLILRLATSGDTIGYSNSVITFLKISNKKWNKYLRNKKILYKKE